MKDAFDVLTATASDLQKKLTDGDISSVQIVQQYLAQIEKHNDYLRAVLELSPHAQEIALKLDSERKSGKVRSPLHGIPVLLKDNIAVSPDLGLKTTAGSFALIESIPKGNASVVDQLLKAGMIVLGKANLSEFANFKGSDIQPGWSPRGGQTQSAYVRGGLVPDGTILGHSSPGGSSTGCAVGLSAGFATLALGTETDGSLITPANRAALYAMRPTQGLVPQGGVIPIANILDTVGPMAKSVEDLANLLTVIVDPSHPNVPKNGYAAALTKTWDGIRVGFLDPGTFFFAPDVIKPNQNATTQMETEIRAAYQKIKTYLPQAQENVSYVTLDDLEYKGRDILSIFMMNDFKNDLENYLRGLATSKVKTLEDIIQFNKDNKDEELPPFYPNQDALESALNAANKLSLSEREEAISWMRQAGGPSGIDKYLKKYNVDVIIGPADCECTEPPAAAGKSEQSPSRVFKMTAKGYPVATMPLSTLDLNGRPFGVSAVASAHQEELLIKVMSAWEATFPPRSVPPTLRSAATSAI
ncbi:hypothetical protein EG329_001239 [Mollisiaceae sp. DMI_Dod_QoI]|nr:hypothetical protein EG329_001239 [Helotiales sp. DMI_Dod_QoI]